MLYELCCGVLPFRGKTSMEVYQKSLEQEPVPPRDRNPQIPVDLEVICLKAMEKERARRFGTAAELADDLQRYLDEFSYRFDRRWRDGELFGFVLRRVVRGQPLPYQRLVAEGTA